MHRTLERLQQQNTLERLEFCVMIQPNFQVGRFRMISFEPGFDFLYFAPDGFFKGFGEGNLVPENFETHFFSIAPSWKKWNGHCPREPSRQTLHKKPETLLLPGPAGGLRPAATGGLKPVSAPVGFGSGFQASNRPFGHSPPVSSLRCWQPPHIFHSIRAATLHTLSRPTVPAAASAVI